jgi:DNA-directed RNA polymerase sigma subunit (sigma70/sigma32)
MGRNGKVTVEMIDDALRGASGACSGGCCGCAGGDSKAAARRQALLERLLPLVPQLDERRRLVLVQRYGLDGEEPKTLQAIGTQLSRTRERIRQIQNMGLEKLQELLAD